MNRRELILTAAAVPLASALPAAAAPGLSEDLICHIGDKLVVQFFPSRAILTCSRNDRVVWAHPMTLKDNYWHMPKPIRWVNDRIVETAKDGWVHRETVL